MAVQLCVNVDQLLGMDVAVELLDNLAREKTFQASSGD